MGEQCGSGVHAIDITSPQDPVFAGCVGNDDFDYCHDAQVVVYNGPDTRFTGKEILFGYMGDSAAVIDVTVKSKPVTIARYEYPDLAFCHQGWLFNGQSQLMLNDELDEQQSLQTARTRSLIFD